MKPEKRRLLESREQSVPWKRWGAYLSERQWGTVREDYSPDGAAWDYISHDAARSRAYRWGEDGIAGFSDDSQLLCFSLALWNGRDPILKERLFGLTGHEGNHGEDVKELYYFLDSTPTHSFMKMLYKYPQAEYPYAELVAENDRRGKSEGEFELLDTGVFDDDRYFDVFAEYAKAESQDVLIRLTAHNRGPDAAEIHLLPQIWFRNTWAWGRDDRRPLLRATRGDAIVATHHELGTFRLYSDGSPQYLFCNNETNERRIHRRETPGFFKDGINDHVVSGDAKAVDPGQEGTKAAAWHRFELAPGESVGVRLRLTPKELTRPFESFDRVFSARQQEADEFYAELQIPVESEDARLVQRQALAGMLWSKQFYYFDVDQWLVPRSEKHLVFFPAFDELGVAMPVAPRDVRQDRPAAVLMIRIVGVGQREIADAREDRFDPIQPRGVGRREDELHVVVGGPVGHLASLVRREVVEHEVEARGDRVARANVREEQQHFAIALAPVAAHHEPIGFDVVGREVLARAMEPPIRRAQPRRVPDLAPRAPMIRAHFDGPELVETDHPAVRRCRPVERTDAFFWRRSPDRGSPSRSSGVGTRSPGRAGCGRAWWHAAP